MEQLKVKRVGVNKLEEKSQSQIDENSWTEYRRLIYQFVLKRVHDPVVAEDIVQDVLVKGYSKQDKLKKSGRMLPWLYMITRHTMVDYFRQKKPTEELKEEMQAGEKGWENNLAKQEMAECLVPLIETLQEPYREALNLSEIGGLSQMEVAKVIGLSLSGTKSRIQRGRHKLRDTLMTCCRVELDHRGVPMDFENLGKCEHC